MVPGVRRHAPITSDGLGAIALHALLVACGARRTGDAASTTTRRPGDRASLGARPIDDLARVAAQCRHPQWRGWGSADGRAVAQPLHAAAAHSAPPARCPTPPAPL